jgi:hypothetical protein
MMIYPSWVVARALVNGADTRVMRGLAAQSVVEARIGDNVLIESRRR